MEEFVEVIAQITFFESDKGGRNIPFGSGFSPKLILDSSPMEYFTELDINDSDTIYPGDQIKLPIKIKGSPGVFLHAGASFDLKEGENTIGTGTVMKVI